MSSYSILCKYIPIRCSPLEQGTGRLVLRILGDVVFSSVDGTTLAETVWTYGKMALRKLMVNRKF